MTERVLSFVKAVGGAALAIFLPLFGIALLADGVFFGAFYHFVCGVFVFAAGAWFWRT